MPPTPPARKTRVVLCPTCGGDSIYEPENTWRPFCSARCKQIDFGAWASEDFRVAQKDIQDDPDPAATGN